MKLYRWSEIPEEPLTPLLTRQMISTEKQTIAYVRLKKGCVVPEHHHDAEQLTYIVQGALEFEIEGKKIVVSTGEVLSIPSNVPHKATALEDTLDLDIFTPVRWDWVNGTDSYLREKQE